jgi:ribosomal protein L7/L12
MKTKDLDALDAILSACRDPLLGGRFTPRAPIHVDAARTYIANLRKENMAEAPYVQGVLDRRAQELLDLLNALRSHPDFDSVYKSIGQHLIFHFEKEEGEALEDRFPKLGLKDVGGGLGVTVASLLATVTDVLCDKRLAFKQEPVDGGDAREGKTVGFQWWNPGEKYKALDKAAETLAEGGPIIEGEKIEGRGPMAFEQFRKVDEYMEKVRDFVRRGKVIEAVKFAREISGRGLAESREFVREIEVEVKQAQNEVSLGDLLADEEFKQKIRELLSDKTEGGKVDALRAVRMKTGCNLQDARAFVARIEETMN